jgi:hypothetical protein
LVPKLIGQKNLKVYDVKLQPFWKLRFSRLDNPVQSQEITMIKSALLATAICFAFIVPASAQQAVRPCDEASLTKMRTEIDAMTDQVKKAETLKAWEAADAAFKANNMEECNARIGDASKNLPPATTTQ